MNVACDTDDMDAYDLWRSRWTRRVGGRVVELPVERLPDGRERMVAIGTAPGWRPEMAVLTIAQVMHEEGTDQAESRPVLH